jgi:hypothetical protein
VEIEDVMLSEAKHLFVAKILRRFAQHGNGKALFGLREWLF